jgi:DNA topoisomerase-1
VLFANLSIGHIVGLPLLEITTTNNTFQNKMESSDDEPLVNVKKKKRIKSEGSAGKKAKSSSSSATKKRQREPEPVKSSSSATKKVKRSSSGGTKEKELKKLDQAERLQYAMQAFLWWNAKEPPEGWQWSTMEHAGVSFPEPYVPHRVKMLYDGQPVDLTPLQEEA